jgi:hypothetical protein
MQFDLKKMTPGGLIELKEKLIHAIDHGEETEEIHFHEHVKGIIGFLRTLKMNNKMVITTLQLIDQTITIIQEQSKATNTITSV